MKHTGINTFNCLACGSSGFDVSVLGPGRCTFCDGTEGGNPPTEEEINQAKKTTPLPKHLEEMRDELLASIKGRAFEALEECSYSQDYGVQEFKITSLIDETWSQAVSIMLKDMESMAKALEFYEMKSIGDGYIDLKFPAKEALKNYREKYGVK